MDKRKIVDRWLDAFDKDCSEALPEAVKRRELIKNSMPPLKIWLGGPGKNHADYALRECIKESLEKQNFEVVLSEEFRGGGDLASKEAAEAEALDLVVIVAMTPGSAAEAIEFAYLEEVKKKAWVYIPSEFKDGYVYRSLSAKHRLATEESLFSLEKFRKFDPDLVIKIINRAISCMNDKHRRIQQGKPLTSS